METNTQSKQIMSAEALELLQQQGLDPEDIKLIAKAKGEVIPPKSSTEAWLERFITVHPIMLRLKDCIRKLAPIEDEVLITGPTGTGKELLANALHGNRPGKFIGINCAGIPENLLESQLFGYTKGAYTGAATDRPGLLKIAAKGTLFLDEIGDMPLVLQSKLLRAIQERKYMRIGGLNDEPVACRFVAATHRNLEAMVEQGLFREDLFYRLSTFQLATLGLDVRGDDVRLILQALNSSLPEDVLKRVTTKHLKGNVRSLQQIVKRYNVLGTLPE